MRGDRVKITTGTLYQDDPNASVFVYGVELDNNGAPLRSKDGAVTIQSLGGVKNGSTGTIMGPPEKAHRSHLKDQNVLPGLGTNDYIQVVPVMLDYYQQLGWFPSENVRVMAGGVTQ
jgi:hypothetical protein